VIVRNAMGRVTDFELVAAEVVDGLALVATLIVAAAVLWLLSGQ